MIEIENLAAVMRMRSPAVIVLQVFFFFFFFFFFIVAVPVLFSLY